MQSVFIYGNTVYELITEIERVNHLEYLKLNVYEVENLIK